MSTWEPEPTHVLPSLGMVVRSVRVPCHDPRLTTGDDVGDIQAIGLGFRVEAGLEFRV